MDRAQTANIKITNGSGKIKEDEKQETIVQDDTGMKTRRAYDNNITTLMRENMNMRRNITGMKQEGRKVERKEWKMI